MAAYALTIFTGAFLLFQVQPLIGKYILPWFGGGPGVWTTCMLFFQVLLLGGYAYAHLSTRCLRPRAQVLLHLPLVLLAVCVLPIVPSPGWKPVGNTDPVFRILLLLTVCLGLPYFVLASTGPLMQHWFSRTETGRSPYRLYALSNAASLLALLSYPVYFETRFTRKAQAGFWGAALVLYAMLTVWCAVKFWRKGEAAVPSTGTEQANEAGVGDRGFVRILLWVLLPACASVLLLATTNKLCQDVAVFPFLWVVPLAFYLLSFVICFDSPRWYQRVPFTLALIAALGSLCWALAEANSWPLWRQAAVYCGGLFLCCMVCHGELYRLRPGPSRLTAFYLCIAAGGALGGCFAALAAPILFNDYSELPLSVFGCGLLFFVVCATDRNPADPSWRWLGGLLPLVAFVGIDLWLSNMSPRFRVLSKSYFMAIRIGMWSLVATMAVFWLLRRRFYRFQAWRLISCGWLGLGLAALATALWIQAHKPGTDIVCQSRNFYGVFKVREYNKHDPEMRYFLLQHGRITHGIQFTDPAQAQLPNSYYGEGSGIALGFHALPQGPRRIGVVGLGTGTMAVYARAGDYLRFYEINPDIEKVARSRFTYLQKCAAKIDVALGDARLSLERESPKNFDVLVLDAFSSDAIPVHLLTREAFALYERHLKTNGVIAVHISNHFLDLEPVLANVIREFRFRAAMIDYDETDEEWWLFSSTWVLLSHNHDLIDAPEICAASSAFQKRMPPIPVWTDDFASVFQILKTKGE